MDGENIAIAATWMDDIRSNHNFDYTHPWHWVSIPDSSTYKASKKDSRGDIIEKLQSLIKTLKKGDLSHEDEQRDLKYLIHLVGDVHQPLHVGRADDRGGNSIKVKWFSKSSNLHRIWDSGMIKSKELSYSELAHTIDYPTTEEIEKWQNSTVLDWAMESVHLRSEVYDFGSRKNLWYPYLYRHWGTVCKRLEQGGVRLAGVINEIYG